MSRAIVVHQTGEPEVMQWEDWPVPAISTGQVRVKHTAIGFNMIDTYRRKGLYPLPLPFIPGSEAAGIVEEVAGDVNSVRVGDRVVYATTGTGAYSEQRIINASELVKLPDDISDDIAAAAFLKGLTAWALLTGVHQLKQNEAVLIYAAAGGVGSILCQWAKLLSARVIGVVGSEEKVAVARQNGCDEVINYNQVDIASTVRALTGGVGVDVVYDSLGQATFNSSLDALKPRGLMVSYGNATGPVAAFNILDLMRKGSLFLTRPQLYSYISTRAELEQGANALFDVIRSAAVSVNIRQRFDLKDAVKAHLVVESKQTTGATILIP
jgi:NADPH2:quinone reductase